MAETVTIDRAYFHTLLRRAEFQVSTSYTAPTDDHRLTVAVARADLDEMVGPMHFLPESLVSRIFNDLCSSHLSRLSYVALENTILINGASDAPNNAVQPYTFTELDSVSGGVRLSRTATPASSVPLPSLPMAPLTSVSGNVAGIFPRQRTPQNEIDNLTGAVARLKALSRHEVYSRPHPLTKPGSAHRRASSDFRLLPRPSDVKSKSLSPENNLGRGESRTQCPARPDDHLTVLITNLPEDTTYKDLTEIVRGGMLLALELMPRSLSASVSFLEEAAARAFLAHARRQPLSIRSNKVDVRWNERQPRISGHILDKARKGATRNIMLHNVTKEVTEQQIRQDLEHIDGLVIVDVSFRFRNVYVALNSIMASFFARICMESRSLYKTTGPVYCADECAQPLPLVPQGLSKDQGTLSVQRSTPSTNRFYILSQESADDGSQNLGTDQDSVDISAPTSSLSWADDTSNL